MIYKCFDKKSQGGGVNIQVKHNEQLTKELHKPIIRNFTKRTVYFRFRDNIYILISGKSLSLCERANFMFSKNRHIVYKT